MCPEILHKSLFLCLKIWRFPTIWRAKPDCLNVVNLNFSNFKTYGLQFQEISSGLKGNYPSFEFEYNCMWSGNCTAPPSPTSICPRSCKTLYIQANAINCPSGLLVECWVKFTVHQIYICTIVDEHRSIHIWINQKYPSKGTGRWIILLLNVL